MPSLNKILFSLLFTASCLAGLVSSCLSATNLALGKPYTVFPPPNYPLTAPPRDRTALTDGIYADAGIMWAQKATVGWKETGTVKITIDLGKNAVIDGITFSTAKGNFGDVNYPARIGVFVGPDQDRLLYVGDLVANADQSPVKYQANRFSLQGIGVKGRFVLLVVGLKGHYLFCDEIGVFEGKQDTGRVGRLSVEDAPGFLADRAILQGLVEQLRPQLSRQPQLAEKLKDVEQKIRAANSSRDVVRRIETDLLHLRGEFLRVVAADREFLIEEIPPWGKFSPGIPPSGASLREIILDLPRGGYDHAAFAITNLSTEARQVTLAVDGLETDAPRITTYQVPFVQSAAMEEVADPLVPVGKGFDLRPGESKMVFVTAHGNKPGAWHNSLSIEFGSDRISIPVNCSVAKVSLPERLSLNSVNWSYLDFKPTRFVKREAMKDLFDHHTKTVVIPSWNLAIGDKPRVDDLVQMNRAYELLKGADRVMLMMAFREDRIRTINGRYRFMSDPWKEWFRKWYDRAMLAATAAGFAKEQIYLYPYDEIDEKEVDQFIAFATWVRREYPGVRLYATVGRKDSEKALPYLDIAQVYDDNDVLRRFSSDKAELWLYNARGPAKSLSPYSYYRLMSWKAFLRGYKGIGFWAYADTGWQDMPSSAWDDFDGKYPDFAVIYDGPGNSIISSRRWEAWRMGIEDYELLSMYAKAKGDPAAKALARWVLDRPDDVTQADLVRRMLVNELAVR